MSRKAKHKGKTAVEQPETQRDATPLVSVVMGVYNQLDREALHQAVDSILNQTLTDLELIIYNDGSVPEASQYIDTLKSRDPRIRITGSTENRGLAFSLNVCIGLARGSYIARMDADDISAPDRLQAQVDYLETHPEVSWCGSNAFLFDEDGIWGTRVMPERPTKEDYLRFSPFIHPSVMYRRELFHKACGYLEKEEVLHCEDYEIFMRLEEMGLVGVNIQEYLFHYRENLDSYRRRTFRNRFNEAKLRYRSFSEMHMLFPKGWLYVLRPIIGGLLPTPLIRRIKKMQAKSIRETHT